MEEFEYLNSAISHQDLDEFKTHFDLGFVNWCGYRRLGLLHLVAMEDAKEICEFLIGNGADVNLKDEFGNTPLHHAAFYGSLNVATILINNGARLEENVDGETPQMLKSWTVEWGDLF